ncbi:hypothetical protein pb186bvf_010831 [Paramecium bursaria]
MVTQGQGKTVVAKRKIAQAKAKDKHGVEHVTNGDIRRLARRGGVKRIARDTYLTTKDSILGFLNNIVRDSIVYTEHADRTTVQANDVILALKRYGRNILLN